LVFCAQAGELGFLGGGKVGRDCLVRHPFKQVDAGEDEKIHQVAYALVGFGQQPVHLPINKVYLTIINYYLP